MMSPSAPEALKRAIEEHARVSKEEDLNHPSQSHADAARELLNEETSFDDAIAAANHARDAVRIDHRWGRFLKEIEDLAIHVRNPSQL